MSSTRSRYYPTHRQARWVPLMVLAVWLSAFISPAQAQSVGGQDACFAAGTATNAVVRFYMAIDRRQFGSAYQCFSPSMQAGTKFSKWKQHLAPQIGLKLSMADDQVPNGTPATHVAVAFDAFDKKHGKLSLVATSGLWHVDPSHNLLRPQLKVIEKKSVKSVSNADPKAVFAAQKLRILKHLAYQVTGPGVADGVFLTTSAACSAYCHSQQLWVYSGGRLVFQQEINDGKIIPWKNHLAMQVRTDTPGAKGFDTYHASERTFITWFWTDFGFILHSRKIVHF